jgi:hypothetical protein
MASYDPEFHNAAKAPPVFFDSAPKRNGCWFYGCVFVIVSLVIALLGLAVFAFVIYRTLTQYVEDYTAEAPIALPKVEIPEERRKSAVDRARKFRDDVKANRKTAPLVLTGDDLNALVQASPKFKDRVYLAIVGDKIKARVSLPLDEFLNTSMTRGRYLNGEAQLKAPIRDGEAGLVVDSIEVEGKPLPDAVRDYFAEPNIVLNLDKNEDDDLLRRIFSFEIKDGEVVITSRSVAPQPPAAPPEPPEPPELPDPAFEPAEAR